MIEDSNLEQGMEELFDETMTEDEAKEASQGNLVPKGRWPGQIENVRVEPYTTSEQAASDGRTNPLEGRRGYHCQIRLYTDEGEKVAFFEFCPALVKATSKAGGKYTPQPCENAGLMYNATKMHGKPWSEVLSFAKENMLVYDVGVRKANDEKGYKARNTLKNITLASE